MDEIIDLETYQEGIKHRLRFYELEDGLAGCVRTHGFQEPQAHERRGAILFMRMTPQGYMIGIKHSGQHNLGSQLNAADLIIRVSDHFEIGYLLAVVDLGAIDWEAEMKQLSQEQEGNLR